MAVLQALWASVVREPGAPGIPHPRRSFAGPVPSIKLTIAQVFSRLPPFSWRSNDSPMHPSSVALNLSGHREFGNRRC